jgi:hypothetical protein
VLQRPLVLVFGLTLGDYLLWNWSAGGGHDVLAAVSGLSLLPLVLTAASLLALALARALADAARPRSLRLGRAAPSAPAVAEPRVAELRAEGLRRGDLAAHEPQAPAATASSGKLAA